MRLGNTSIGSISAVLAAVVAFAAACGDPQIGQKDQAASLRRAALPADSSVISDAHGFTNAPGDATATADGLSAEKDAANADLALWSVCEPLCDDANPCTDDYCAPDKSCVHLANKIACDDGDSCTLADQCAGGHCAPETLFDQAGLGNEGDQAFAMAALADGGYVLAGADGFWAPYGIGWMTGLAMLRTDAKGKLLWRKSLLAGNGGVVRGIAQTADGGFALAAEADAQKANGSYEGSSDNFWLLRVSSSGEAIWAKMYNGKDNATRAFGVVALDDGGAAAAGYCVSNWESCGSSPTKSQEFRLLRVDGDGNVLWDKYYGGSGNDAAHAIVKAPGTGFALAGSTESKILPGGQHTAGQADFWLVRTDLNGVMLWNRTYGGSSEDFAYAVTAMSDGGFALAGSTQSKDLANPVLLPGKRHGWLVRTDAAGNLLWSQMIGAGYEEILYGVAGAKDGILAVVGSSAADGSGRFMARTDPFGNVVWQASPANGGPALATTSLSNNDFAVTGWQTGAMWLKRMNMWGHGTCAQAGVCMGLNCDDGNSCTKDLCYDTMGCKHTPLAEGSRCGNGKTCKVGGCL